MIIDNTLKLEDEDGDFAIFEKDVDGNISISSLTCVIISKEQAKQLSEFLITDITPENQTSLNF